MLGFIIYCVELKASTRALSEDRSFVLLYFLYSCLSLVISCLFKVSLKCYY